MLRIRTLLIAIAALLIPAGAMAQNGVTRLTPPAGPWTPPGVEVAFPDQIGEYARFSVVEYAPDNWSVGYTLHRGGQRLNVATVYLYAHNPDQSCVEEFEGSAGSIERNNPGAKRVSTSTAASPAGRMPGAAHRALYSLSSPYGSAEDMALLSELYFYCKAGTKWWVKVRASWPATTDRSADTATILRGIKWPANVAD
ncbi:MAG: hypothetical protein EOP62_18065 [Sphingomonadales bacterium]|nr:MAG: hypothetical protein EOP62_18065 [Sphingomonadales bacterium]